MERENEQPKNKLTKIQKSNEIENEKKKDCCLWCSGAKEERKYKKNYCGMACGSLWMALGMKGGGGIESKSLMWNSDMLGVSEKIIVYCPLRTAVAFFPV